MKKVVDLFWKTLSNVAFFCFTAMLVVMIMQVFSRYALRVSIPWTEETTRYFFIWAIFLGSALAQRNREHIRIDIIVDRLPPQGRKIFEFLTDVFDTLISIAIFIGTVRMMKSTYGILASTLPISFTFVYLALALCIGMMLILILKDIFKAVFCQTNPKKESIS